VGFGQNIDFTPAFDGSIEIIFHQERDLFFFIEGAVRDQDFKVQEDFFFDFDAVDACAAEVPVHIEAVDAFGESDGEIQHIGGTRAEKDHAEGNDIVVQVAA